MYSIAIDGPAGAGKSTIAKGIAKELGFVYVDTGAMFRTMALYFLKNEINAEDSDGIKAGCQNMNIKIEYKENEQQMILNGENVTAFIRTEEVGNMASSIAVNPSVRTKLLELQRELAKTTNVVMDGRDIGTCVLPDADLKIFLTASARERATRRYKELTQRGVECDINEIETDIKARDERDMNRDIAPLKQAEDAILIDSSNLSIEKVIQAILTEYNK